MPSQFLFFKHLEGNFLQINLGDSPELYHACSVPHLIGNNNSAVFWLPSYFYLGYHSCQLSVDCKSNSFSMDFSLKDDLQPGPHSTNGGIEKKRNSKLEKMATRTYD